MARKVSLPRSPDKLLHRRPNFEKARVAVVSLLALAAMRACFHVTSSVARELRMKCMDCTAATTAAHYAVRGLGLEEPN